MTRTFERVERVDAARRWQAALGVGGGCLAVVAVSARGHTLVVDTRATLRWLDERLVPMTDAFAAPAEWDVAVALADGSVAFGYEGSWRFELRDGETSPTCAPARLRARPTSTVVHVVRGGEGYALLQRVGDSPATVLELLTVAGVSCGTVMVPHLPDNLSVGADGTLLAVALAKGPPRACIWRWWPGLLR